MLFLTLPWVLSGLGTSIGRPMAKSEIFSTALMLLPTPPSEGALEAKGVSEIVFQIVLQRYFELCFPTPGGRRNTFLHMGVF